MWETKSIILTEGGCNDQLWMYCYKNGNDVLKIINNSSKNRNNVLVYMINEYKKINEYRRSIKIITGQRNKQAATKCA